MVQKDLVFGREKAEKETRLKSKKTQVSSKERPVVKSNLGGKTILTEEEKKALLLFRSIAHPTLSSSKYKTRLQALKTALYNKDYTCAFEGEGDEGLDGKDVYIARWTPGRVLVYRRVFQLFLNALDITRAGDMLILGGGAGPEILSFISLSDTTESTWRPQNINAVDFGTWEPCVAKYVEGFSKTYHEQQVHFQQADLLDKETRLDLANAALITIFFTISELFLQSSTRTLLLLASITKEVIPGTVLLILESASLAEIPIGKSGRIYPLGMLLDHSLEEMGAWEIIENGKEDSKWFRMPEGVESCYPEKLENMRVVLRAYRRL